MELRLGIVVGSVREGRFGERPARWLHALAEGRAGASYEIMDLKDHPLPPLDAPTPPAREPSSRPEVRAWAGRVAACDGFVFVTPEYNHGIPGPLKNALDWVYREWARKPAAFLGYGGVGGARAVEQLRLVCAELRLAPLGAAVHVAGGEFGALARGERDFADLPHLARSAVRMLDELEWWARALKAARDQTSRDSASR